MMNSLCLLLFTCISASAAIGQRYDAFVSRHGKASEAQMLGIAVLAEHVVNGSKVSLLVVKGVIAREAFEDVDFKKAKTLVTKQGNGRMEPFSQFQGIFEWRSPDGKYRAFYSLKERTLLMHYTPLHREPSGTPTAP